jgi:eukaryotic-like serine/threonine-protein kinase
VTRAGLILGDRYRLDERIAAGGVGQVWRATDLLLGRAVAVKALRPEYADHPDTLERFRKEARHAGAISNAHVAQLYDYGPMGPDGSPYLVMEFVDGPSLADILVIDPIEPTRALDIVSQAADGLAAAHKVGLVHRDVKPGNILIGKEGQVKVTDFGIAHAAGQAPVTGPGLVMGTTQYMAPERIAGDHGTAASDVYALGIVLHECLTGVPPHDGNPAEVMAAHLYLPLPPLPFGTPPEVEDLVAQLTVKDPARRISDARELSDLAAMLRDSLSGVPHVPPTGTGAYAASGAAVASSVPQVGALAAEPGPAQPGDLASPAAAYAAAYGIGADRAVRGGGVNGAAMPPPTRLGGRPPAYVSDEWHVPERMSLPAGPGGAGQPKPPRRRKGGVIAVGAAVAASAGLAALLVSGAFSSAPAANQLPAGSPTTGSPTLGRVPSPASSASAGAAKASPGGVTGPGGATTPGRPASQATTAGKKPAAGSPGRPSASSPASPAPGSTPSAAPSSSAPAETPASSPSTPSGTPSSPAASTPSPAPSATKSACVLVICL